MSASAAVQEIEEFEEYYEEEEVVSYYDTGLSTIQEVDEEDSHSSHSRHHCVGGKRKDPLNKASNHAVPENISLANSPRRLESSSSLSPRPLCMVSPLLFSPMSQARKFALKSPLIGSRANQKSTTGMKGSTSPPPTRSSTTTAAASTTTTTSGLVLTNLFTGEELITDADDDEFTFVSCSDTESILGAAMSNFEEYTIMSEGSASSLFSLPTSFGNSNNATTTSTIPSSSNFDVAKEHLEIAMDQQKRQKQNVGGGERTAVMMDPNETCRNYTEKAGESICGQVC